MFFGVLSFLFTILPILSALVLAASCVRASARLGDMAVRAAAVLVLAGSFLAFFASPHDDSFSGLDTMAYRHLSEAFRSGRGMLGADTNLLDAPRDLRLLFIGNKSRMNRDSTFQIMNIDTCEARPYYIPTMPLAASGMTFLPVEYFTPLVGGLWCVALELAALALFGFGGLVCAAALVFCTPFPIWFMRGFYAEATGSALISCVMIAFLLRQRYCRSAPPGRLDSSIPQNGGERRVVDVIRRRLGLGARLCASAPKARASALEHFSYGFAAGWSVCYHPTFVVYGGCIAAGIFLFARGWRDKLALLLGGAIGVAPLVLITLFVCQPYGNWLSVSALRGMIGSAGQIRALFLALCAIVPVFVALVAVSGESPVRRRMEAALSPGEDRGGMAFAICALIALAASAAVCGMKFRAGAASFVAGIGVTGAILFAASFAALCLDSRKAGRNAQAAGEELPPAFSGSRFAESGGRGGDGMPPGNFICRFGFVAAIAFAAFGIAVAGSEKYVSLWNFRRMLPGVITLVTASALSLGGLFGGRLFPRRKNAQTLRASCVAAVAVLGLANAARCPSVYFDSSQNGASMIVKAEKKAFGKSRKVVFDYQKAAMPLSPDLGYKVFATCFQGDKYMTDFSKMDGMMDWLAAPDRDGGGEPGGADPIIVTSYAPCLMEKDAMFTSVGTNEYASVNGTYREIVGKRMLGAEVRIRASRNLPLHLARLSPGDWTWAFQDKRLDGGPLGLRGRWGWTKGAMTWTTQDSGVVGPVVPEGQTVVIALTGRSGSDAPRDVVVTPPWGGDGVTITLPPEEASVSGVIACTRAMPPQATGVYRISSPDPRNFGLREDCDYGVQLRRIVIRPLAQLLFEESISKP